LQLADGASATGFGCVFETELPRKSHNIAPAAIKIAAAIDRASTRGGHDVDVKQESQIPLEVWMQSQSLRRFIIIPVLLSLPLSGCFSAYRLSDSQSRVLTNLTRERAIEIVRRNIARTDQQGGLCHEIFKDRFDHDSNYSVDSSQVALDGTIVHYKTKEEILGAGHAPPSGPAIGGVRTISIASLVIDIPLEADLTQLQQIWVESEDYVCAFRKYSGRQVTLVVTRSGLHQQWLSFGLAPGNFDEFLAAVKYLSPNATLRGHGI
jgi:hypothetical protein